MTVMHASYHVLLLGVTVATVAVCTRNGEAQCQYEVTVAQGPWCGDIFQYPPTRGKAINEAGDVAGYYDSCALGPARAFVWTAEAGLVTLNIPGASQSTAEDISGQLIVGHFNDPDDEFSNVAFVSDGAADRTSESHLSAQFLYRSGLTLVAHTHRLLA